MMPKCPTTRSSLIITKLAGWSGRGAQYLADGGSFSWSIPDRLDQQIESKQMPPAIVIFPDCSTKLGASQYVNSPVNGNYMDYLCDELVDWVDDRFHTHKSRDYRGVIGHSSGGFGALASERAGDHHHRRDRRLRPGANLPQRGGAQLRAPQLQ